MGIRDLTVSGTCLKRWLHVFNSFLEGKKQKQQKMVFSVFGGE